jgi:hypothetical protein
VSSGGWKWIGPSASTVTSLDSTVSRPSTPKPSTKYVPRLEDIGEVAAFGLRRQVLDAGVRQREPCGTEIRSRLHVNQTNPRSAYRAVSLAERLPSVSEQGLSGPGAPRRPAGSDSGTDVTEALGATTPFPFASKGSSQAHAGIGDQRVEQFRVKPQLTGQLVAGNSELGGHFDLVQQLRERRR